MHTFLIIDDFGLMGELARQQVTEAHGDTFAEAVASKLPPGQNIQVEHTNDDRVVRVRAGTALFVTVVRVN